MSNAHKEKVPADWIRKQTLVNAERYITEELKVYEEKILGAEEKLVVIEQRLFNELVAATAEYVKQIQQNARLLATIDCLSSFAQVARHNTYAKPTFTDGDALTITAGRHPVIEKQLPPGEPYVPNDIHLDADTQQVMIITGPNMAGKSALLRQTALIVLMAQMGSFVPADAGLAGHRRQGVHPGRRFRQPSQGRVYLYGGNDRDGQHYQQPEPVQFGADG